MSPLPRILLIGALAPLWACGPQASIGDDGDGGSGADGGPGVADADPSRSDALPPPENAAVYAHSSTHLYRVDPDTLEVSLIGAFEGLGLGEQMTDIAIDKDGEMIGVTFGRVYAVDKDTAACTELSTLSDSFNGLSFVPSQGPDPGDEILVGATENGNVYEIDPMTGASTQVGAYGGGLGSSGDLVSVRGFGTVATVSGAGATDHLARIDPQAGYQATLIGDTGFNSIWGLGFWGDKVYGFTDDREFVLIDVDTGEGTSSDADDVRWWGAAVTTSAPVVD